MIRALLLDAAGTLIEPAESVADVYTRIATAHGIAAQADRVRQAFGPAFAAMPDPDYPAHSDGDAAERIWWRSLVTIVLRRSLPDTATGDLAEDTLESCFHALFHHYAQPDAWLVFPEVREVLHAAREAGLRLTVVSNFDLRLHAILAGHDLHFDAVITSADARARKPRPEIFHLALRLLDLPPEAVHHAGDSPHADLKGAAALGIPATLIHRPGNDLRALLPITSSLT
ncbi:HAD family hydrolase [Luteolibacter flavescens]|uniref:HAD family hydrolase n=1 Tax=Luteolibacter flavescens TaxID=1859460 RepID=A0ABT3FQZ9_9BACT|nr:HAD family hydrolase [Luteolibacter flavescens]MCW1885998.1 HAD family hydrolase [Luteolibacter flavescens]